MVGEEFSTGNVFGDLHFVGNYHQILFLSFVQVHHALCDVIMRRTREKSFTQKFVCIVIQKIYPLSYNNVCESGCFLDHLKCGGYRRVGVDVNLIENDLQKNPTY